MALKTDYVDDELAVSMGSKRQYNIVDSKGNIIYENVHIEDTSKYSTVGDDFGAEDINATNGAVNQLNADLSDFKFRVNSGVPEFSINDGTTWNKLGGGTMKTMFGTVAPTSASATIDISSLNLSSADDYFVILNAGQVVTGNSESQYGSFGHITAKTNTSFTIGDISSSPGGIRPSITYQVVYNA